MIRASTVSTSDQRQASSQQQQSRQHRLLLSDLCTSVFHDTGHELIQATSLIITNDLSGYATVDGAYELVDIGILMRNNKDVRLVFSPCSCGAARTSR